MNGADRLCEALLANGVDVCFANPGTSEMHFVASLDRRPEMRCVLGLFEGVVTGAADGYARMADKPAATLLHLGPGLANGLANLHNARRAHTPVLNVVGNHATDHVKYDAPLTSDIESLARPMSAFVRSVGDEMTRDVNDAFDAAMATPGVATLILPADKAWSPSREQQPPPRPPRAVSAPAREDYDRALSALAAGGRTAFLLGGKALRHEALSLAGAICAKTGARMFAETSNARIERGRGRFPIDRIPYRIDAAVEVLRDVDTLILIGAADPAAFFAYPDKPARPYRPDCNVIALAMPSHDLKGVLQRLARDCAATPVAPPDGLKVQAPPTEGPLTGEAISRVVAALLPDNAIVCDESITAGWMFYGLSHCSAPHDYLELTGGAIGIGIPLSIGAAVACPDRKVVCLQADGSGMYTVQGLWTQAREDLDVVTVVFSNRTYQTLHGEMRNVGVNTFGENAKRMLNLDNPSLDWAAISGGFGVPAARADTIEAFTTLLRQALSRHGPSLIEATIEK